MVQTRGEPLLHLLRQPLRAPATSVLRGFPKGIIGSEKPRCQWSRFRCSNCYFIHAYNGPTWKRCGVCRNDGPERLGCKACGWHPLQPHQDRKRIHPGRQAHQRPAIAPVLAVGLLIVCPPLVDGLGPVATPAAREFTEPCRLWTIVSTPLQFLHRPLQTLHPPLQRLHTMNPYF